MITSCRIHPYMHIVLPALVFSLLFFSLKPGLADNCPCLGGVDNYCSYGPSYPDCGMTYPGGYCDPNGDGNFSDADWVRGLAQLCHGLAWR
jgi:hypothetical protein